MPLMIATINIEWGDIMEDKCPPLIDILSEIPDFRKSKGKRHPLSAILALACVAMMCGHKGYRAFAEWRSNYGDDLIDIIGNKEILSIAHSPCIYGIYSVS